MVIIIIIIMVIIIIIIMVIMIIVIVIMIMMIIIVRYLRQTQCQHQLDMEFRRSIIIINIQRKMKLIYVRLIIMFIKTMMIFKMITVN